MVSLSIIFEDAEDGSGKVTVKSRSTQPLPEDINKATPAEMIMAEVAGWVAQHYPIDSGGVIDMSSLMKVETPKIIV